MEFSKYRKYIQAVVLLIAAMIFAIAGTSIIFSTKKNEKNCTEKASATIYEIKEKSHVFGESHYRLLFKYDFRGKEYTGKSSLSSNSYKSFNVDDVIEITVNPEKPEECLFDSARTLLIGKFFVGAGIITLLAAIISAVSTIRSARKIQ